jgi:hypothetical protein
LLGFGVEQPVGRTTDAIGLRACFSAVDCRSTARSWGWNRSTPSRRVKASVASGQLVRTPGPDGRSVFTARTPGVAQACNAAAVLVSPSAKSLVIPTVSLPVQSAAQGEHPVVGVMQHFGGWRLLSEGLGRCPRRASSGCLKRTSASKRATPLVALCEPTRCPNAACHRPVWTRAADDARILLLEKRLSKLQRAALRRGPDRIEAVLDGITKPASPDPLARSSPIRRSSGLFRGVW